MKNTYMKSFIVACAAAFTFIGLQSSTAEAHTEYQVFKGDNFQKFGQQYGITIDHIKQENNLLDDWTYIEAMLPIPDKTKVLAVQLLKPAIEIPHKAKVLAAQSSKPAIQTPPETKVLAVQSSKPAIQTPPETKVLAVQSTKPAMKPAEKEPAKPAVSISNKEKDLFARLVEAEAKGEPYKGKVAVATVVLNRVDSPQFPDTVTDVINQVVGGAYAFSPVQNGEINKPASDEAKRAVDEALTRKDRLNDCIYFYNPEIATDDWIRTRNVVKTIGNHVFAK
ncbi:cell wall hydrolase [Bacillus songklensis]|uniref:Cell wall hydrolase n=1 Tax=Bacillus songklensis TaxID=1069116 RepID=A0ABV8B7D3_9BACI